MKTGILIPRVSAICSEKVSNSSFVSKISELPLYNHSHYNYSLHNHSLHNYLVYKHSPYNSSLYN